MCWIKFDAEEQIIAKINGHCSHTGKVAKIIAVNVVEPHGIPKPLTLESITEIKIPGGETSKLVIDCFENKHDVLALLNSQVL